MSSHNLSVDLKRLAEIEETAESFSRRGKLTNSHEIEAQALRSCGHEARAIALAAIEDGLNRQVTSMRQGIISRLKRELDGTKLS